MNSSKHVDCMVHLKTKAILWQVLDQAARSMPLLTEADREQWGTVNMREAIEAVERKSPAAQCLHVSLAEDRYKKALRKLEESEYKARLAPVHEAAKHRKVAKILAAPVCLENQSGETL